MSGQAWTFEEYGRAPEAEKSPRSIIREFIETAAALNGFVRVLAYPRLGGPGMAFATADAALHFIEQKRVWSGDGAIAVFLSAGPSLARLKSEYERVQQGALDGWSDCQVFPVCLPGLEDGVQQMALDRDAALGRIVVFYHDADPMFVLAPDE
jgi:hypothetical protein